MGKHLQIAPGLDPIVTRQLAALARAFERGEQPRIATYCLQKPAVRFRTGASGTRLKGGVVLEIDGWDAGGWSRLIDDGTFDYDGSEKVIDIWGVTEGTKRDGSEVLVDGINTTLFRKNPVFAKFHQYDQPSIGRVVATRIGKTRDGKKGLQISVARLATPLLDDNGRERKYVAEAGELMDLIEYADQRAVSYGWLSEKFAPILDSQERVTGMRHIQSQALEWSTVTVPADGDATLERSLARALVEGRITPEAATMRACPAVYIMRDVVEPEEEPAPPVVVQVPVMFGMPATVPATTVAQHVASEVEAIMPNRLDRWLAGFETVHGRAFDPQAIAIAPANVMLDLAARYCERPVRELAESGTFVPASREGAWLLALEARIADGWTTEAVRNIVTDYPRDEIGKERPLVRAAFQLTSTRRQEFVTDGVLFLRTPTGAPVVVKLAQSWCGLVVDAYAPLDNADARSLLDGVWSRAIASKLLKGEAFTLGGDFIERRGDASFDNLFLTDAQSEELRLVTSLIKERGATMAKRGEMLVGPPGTGKTTAGRVLLNECSEATFIWISARDFFSFGPIRTFALAFDLARELAPSILCFEDVDTWINTYTVDQLKTEMDGMDARQNDGVVTVLTSNHPEYMPAALIRRPGRFNKVMKFDLPDATIRERMIRAWLPAALASEAAVAAALRATDGYSGAHVRNLVDFALILHEQQGIEPGEAIIRACAELSEQAATIADACQRSAADVPTVAHRQMIEATWDRLEARAEYLGVPLLWRSGKVIAKRNMDKLEAVRDALRTIAGAAAAGAESLQAVIDDAGAEDQTDPTVDDAAPMVAVASLARDLRHLMVSAPVASELRAIATGLHSARERIVVEPVPIAPPLATLAAEMLATVRSAEEVPPVAEAEAEDEDTEGRTHLDEFYDGITERADAPNVTSRRD